MHPPTGRLGKLSLNMVPVTRSQSRGEERLLAEKWREDADEDEDQDQEDRDQEDEDDDEDRDQEEDEDQEDDGPVRSPMTGLLYDVDGLDDETQELVRELFRRPMPEETPPMVVEWCGISNDPDVYAFQLREVVPRTIRIGSPSSRIPRPSCNCTGSAAQPCRHLVWLMDQIARQTVHDHDDQPLVLDAQGFPHALAGPRAHSRIADFHIDVLARTLHCSPGPPIRRRPDVHRVREAREILAGLAGVRDDVSVDAFAPDLFDVGPEQLRQMLWGGKRRKNRTSSRMEMESHDSDSDHSDNDDSSSSSSSSSSSFSSQPLLRLVDLQRTVLRLLLSNDEFFGLFLKLLSPSDKARDPFRKIQQRVAHVLDILLTPASALASEQVTVEWAARHVQNAVEQIHILLEQPQHQQNHHRASACRALVWIFNSLVFHHNRDVHAGPTQDDRNLYQRLIGNAGGLSVGETASASEPASENEPAFFLLDELQLLCDQVQFRTQLEHIHRRIQINGYRQPYMRRLEAILLQMRAFRVEYDTDEDEEDHDDNNDNSHGSSPPLLQTIHGTTTGSSSSPAAGSKRHRSAVWPSSDRGSKRVREAG